MSTLVIGPISNTTKERADLGSYPQSHPFRQDGAGDRIIETQLAKELGVGNTAVREALFGLESKGFVRRIANKGTFVTQLTVDDVLQIFRARREMEGLAAELLAERVRKADIDLLQKFVDQMGRAAEHNRLEDFCHFDIEFHTTIWRLSGNRFLAGGLENMVIPLFAFFNMACPPGSGDTLRDSVEQHAQVVQAFRDGKDVRKRMEAAIDYFQHEKLKLLFEVKVAG
jgi:DNA-binding GntR family transcriptional regulator